MSVMGACTGVIFCLLVVQQLNRGQHSSLMASLRKTRPSKMLSRATKSAYHVRAGELRESSGARRRRLRVDHLKRAHPSPRTAIWRAHRSSHVHGAPHRAYNLHTAYPDTVAASTVTHANGDAVHKACAGGGNAVQSRVRTYPSPHSPARLHLVQVDPLAQPRSRRHEDRPPWSRHGTTQRARTRVRRRACGHHPDPMRPLDPQLVLMS